MLENCRRLVDNMHACIFSGCFVPGFILPSLFNVLNDECGDQLQKVYESMKTSGQV